MRSKNVLTTLSIALSLAVWLTAPSVAGNSLYAKADNDWITLTGQVKETQPHGFQLDYGDGMISVELDDWDEYDEAQHLKEGEHVSVYGRIDEAFFENRTIEAGTVYVFGRNVYYHASAADEEGDHGYWGYAFAYPHYPDGEWMSLAGTVQSIDGREFVLDLGALTMVVDTDQMAYNPLDKDGYQQIEVGDRVSAWGHLDYDLFEERELKASTIVTLRESRSTGGSS